MKLSVKGKSKSTSLAEVRYATKFFTELLFVDKKSIVPELDVIIKFEKIKYTEKGNCWPDDDEDDPRLFTIQINRTLNRKQVLRTIAHELVHVRSFAINELKYHDGNTIMWRRKVISTDKIDYWDLPSEIEAYGREEGLYVRYLEHLSETGVKFLKPKEKIQA